MIGINKEILLFFDFSFIIVFNSLRFCVVSKNKCIAIEDISCGLFHSLQFYHLFPFVLLQLGSSVFFFLFFPLPPPSPCLVIQHNSISKCPFPRIFFLTIALFFSAGLIITDK